MELYKQKHQWAQTTIYKKKLIPIQNIMHKKNWPNHPKNNHSLVRNQILGKNKIHTSPYHQTPKKLAQSPCIQSNAEWLK